MLKYVFMAGIMLFAGCASTRVMQPVDVKVNNEVKLYLRSGEVTEGLVLDTQTDGIVFVSGKTQNKSEIAFDQIRRIEPAQNHYDYEGKPISDAEIRKYRGTKNTWGYALGGGVIGGAAGLVLGYPVWLANDNPPPLFSAGIGFVVGSIYYATKGVKKDRSAALVQVRELRKRENELEAMRQEESQKLDALKAEKERLEKELEEKRKKDVE